MGAVAPVRLDMEQHTSNQRDFALHLFVLEREENETDCVGRRGRILQRVERARVVSAVLQDFRKECISHHGQGGISTADGSGMVLGLARCIAT